jgi:hypothetical protein
VFTEVWGFFVRFCGVVFLCILITWNEAFCQFIIRKCGVLEGGVFAAGMEGEIELLRFGKALASFSHHGDTESTEIQAK